MTIAAPTRAKPINRILRPFLLLNIDVKSPCLPRVGGGAASSCVLLKEGNERFSETLTAINPPTTERVTPSTNNASEAILSFGAMRAWKLTMTALARSSKNGVFVRTSKLEVF